MVMFGGMSRGAGYESGLKNRPCVVVLATEKQNNEVVVTVAPITHSPPDAESAAIEIPRVVKERLGLDDETSWVVITEVNRFIWPGHDIVPVSETPPLRYEYGVLPPLLYRRQLCFYNFLMPCAAVLSRVLCTAARLTPLTARPCTWR